MGKAIDITGHTFGRLTALRLAEKRGKKRYWVCQCSCGKLAEVAQCALAAGLTRSCGCLKAELDKKRRDAPAVGDLPEYWVWAAMITRCHSPRCKSFPNYGGRGILVCARWCGPGGFSRFIADMGPRPSRNHTIERKDNDGPYSPENCCWSTRHHQNRNTRQNRSLTLNGKTMLLVEWAGEIGVSISTLSARLNRHGWSVERALTTPVRTWDRA